MLFSVFNLIMIALALTGAFYGWRYLHARRELDASLSAVIATFTLALFSAYVMVLGLSTVISSMFDSVRAVVSFISKLWS